MFKKLLWIVLILCVASFGQDMNQLKKTVAFLYGQSHVKDQNGVLHLLDGSLGTAFFVFYPDPRGGTNYGYTYIVTAKHVLKDEAENKYLRKVRIRMNKVSVRQTHVDGGREASLEIVRPVSASGSKLWV
jgi:hypothetical protein